MARAGAAKTNEATAVARDLVSRLHHRTLDRLEIVSGESAAASESLALAGSGRGASTRIESVDEALDFLRLLADARSKNRDFVYRALREWIESRECLIADHRMVFARLWSQAVDEYWGRGDDGL